MQKTNRRARCYRAEELFVNSYIPIAVLVLVATVIAAAMVGGSFFLGPKKPGAQKEVSYECGMTPVGSARERFPIKFYLIAMLFIVFDIETIFLYPWAVNYGALGHSLKVFNFIEMAVFVGLFCSSAIFTSSAKVRLIGTKATRRGMWT